MRSVLLILLFTTVELAQASGPGVSFTENKGQWPEKVLYRALIPGGALFVERDAFTYVIRTGDLRHHHGDADHHHGIEGEPKVHAWRVDFENGLATSHSGSYDLPHYENFFLGNDPDSWGTECRVYKEVILRNVWPGIDLRLDGSSGLKYDLLVAPSADPSQAVFRYEGQDELLLIDGDLHVRTSAGTLVEKAPVIFSVEKGRRIPLGSRYALNGAILGFHIDGQWDNSLPLVIDPELSFASYVGSSASNFGFTATYDDDGHLYGGGIVFGVGYPTTVGVLDPDFNGGTTDVGISKWSPDGTTLVWSTYLGGTMSEAPHSLVVNSSNELFILGSTGSSDFPTTPGCYDPGFSGGPSVSFDQGYGFSFPQGVDVFISRINMAGSALIGSTYFGGSGTDGLNMGAGLAYNYGDPFRGEIALDANDTPLVSTSTTSTDMPTTAGASQASYGGGGSDAFFIRMNAALTNLMWGTYHGGSGSDSGYGIQAAGSGQIYCTGGTNSTNLPVAGNPFHATNSGGIDGYIARYNNTGASLLSTTYLGTSQYDQTFFVQLDVDDDVYVVGQTRGNYPVTPGKYSNPGSSQFIHKLTPDLSTSLWSTRIGNGSGTEDIAPSAFMVSDCRQIYFSGWGGSTNNIGTPTASTTNGLPTTAGAFQTTTDGSDFYLMVLEPEAVALNYGTFFGGSEGTEHVDGGTSRFDKNGKVYQAVCAGCFGIVDFPTTPDAWSNSTNSASCNLAVVKFDLAAVIAVISIDGPDVVCAPASVNFSSSSSGGDTFIWYLDGSVISNTANASHTFTVPGTYDVSLVVSDSHDCVIGDSIGVQITVLPAITASIEPIEPVCPGGDVQLIANPPGQNYSWSPAFGLSATDVQDPIASPGQNTTYQVVISGDCGTDSTTVDVEYAVPVGSALPDVTICIGESATLGASGGVTYAWTPGESLSDPASATPVATPTDTTVYTVSIITDDGCEIIDSVRVNVVFSVPEPIMEDVMICDGASVQLTAPLADWYQWQPANGLLQLDIASPIVTPSASTAYIVLCGNACGTTLDTAYVDLVTVIPNAWPAAIVCPGTPIQLHASGGTHYSWAPATWLNDASSDAPICTPGAEVHYMVTVTDDLGCSAETELIIRVHPVPYVFAGHDIVADYGHQVQLHGEGDGQLHWEPSDMVDPADANDPWTKPEESTLYTITVTDQNGCKASDEVWVILNGSLFVPNTFTPNGDGVNDFFGAWGKEITDLKLQIFDRWGEMIFEGNDIEQFWDGTYAGKPCQIDTYVWRIDVRERNGDSRTLFGHVNLVR